MNGVSLAVDLNTMPEANKYLTHHTITSKRLEKLLNPDAGAALYRGWLDRFFGFIFQTNKTEALKQLHDWLHGAHQSADELITEAYDSPDSAEPANCSASVIIENKNQLPFGQYHRFKQLQSWARAENKRDFQIDVAPNSDIHYSIKGRVVCHEPLGPLLHGLTIINGEDFFENFEKYIVNHYKENKAAVEQRLINQSLKVPRSESGFEGDELLPMTIDYLSHSDEVKVLMSIMLEAKITGVQLTNSVSKEPWNNELRLKGFYFTTFAAAYSAVNHEIDVKEQGEINRNVAGAGTSEVDVEASIGSLRSALIQSHARKTIERQESLKS